MPRLDISELVPVVLDLFEAGLAPSTQRVYRTGGSSYRKFCADAGLIDFPTSEHNLMLFVAHLHSRKLAPGTMKSYLAAVRYLQISMGLGNPRINEMPKLEYLMKGVKRAAPGGVRRRLPITVEILAELKLHWLRPSAGTDVKMLWAVSCLCFFGFLRLGEAVAPSPGSYDLNCHLCFGDVLVDSRSAPSYLQVNIKASKTDPFRQGCTIYIGATKSSICPVAAVLSFMVARGSAPGPLFTWEGGQFLTRERMVAELRSALRARGIQAKDYAGHSFRIGAATTAARRGIQDSLIKTLGRWESSAYMSYVRTAPKLLQRVAGTLVAK